MFSMPKNLIFIFLIFFFTSDVFAQRLLLGASTTDIMFKKKDLTSPEQYNYNSDERYQNQRLDNFPNKFSKIMKYHL